MDRRTIPGLIVPCDFCNASVPDIRTFDAAPVSITVDNTTIYFCDSKWAACAACSQLIDEGRWDELTERSYLRWIEKETQNGQEPGFRLRQFMRAHLAQLHRLFREARGRTA